MPLDSTAGGWVGTQEYRPAMLDEGQLQPSHNHDRTMQVYECSACARQQRLEQPLVPADRSSLGPCICGAHRWTCQGSGHEDSRKPQFGSNSGYLCHRKSTPLLSMPYPKEFIKPQLPLNCSHHITLFFAPPRWVQTYPLPGHQAYPLTPLSEEAASSDTAGDGPDATQVAVGDGMGPQQDTAPVADQELNSRMVDGLDTRRRSVQLQSIPMQFQRDFQFKPERTLPDLPLVPPSYLDFVGPTSLSQRNMMFSCLEIPDDQSQGNVSMDEATFGSPHASESSTRGLSPKGIKSPRAFLRLADIAGHSLKDLQDEFPPETLAGEMYGLNGIGITALPSKWMATTSECSLPAFSIGAATPHRSRTPGSAVSSRSRFSTHSLQASSPEPFFRSFKPRRFSGTSATSSSRFSAISRSSFPEAVRPQPTATVAFSSIATRISVPSVSSNTSSSTSGRHPSSMPPPYSQAEHPSPSQDMPPSQMAVVLAPAAKTQSLTVPANAPCTGLRPRNFNSSAVIPKVPSKRVIRPVMPSKGSTPSGQSAIMSSSISSTSCPLKEKQPTQQTPERSHGKRPMEAPPHYTVTYRPAYPSLPRQRSTNVPAEVTQKVPGSALAGPLSRSSSLRLQRKDDSLRL